MRKAVYVIAEAGVNHNGKSDLALQLVDAAVAAQADAVKFQTFQADKLASSNIAKAAYQQLSGSKAEKQLAMLKKLELKPFIFLELKKYCDSNKIEFLSTAFDVASLYFLNNEVGLEKFKVASGEITNAPLLLAFAQTNKPLIVSTGMANMGEIEQALSVIAFGFVAEKTQKPSITAFYEAYASTEAQELLRRKVTLLHCTSQYPAPLDDINLTAMQTLRDTFKLPVGYSDHSEGIVVPIAAVAQNATIIEKHLTLDKNMPGPDHKASITPLDFQHMVKHIRQIERAMGDGIKRLQNSELDTKNIARKTLVADSIIKRGEQFSKSNLTSKRADFGLSPFLYWDYLEKVASRNYEIDEVIND